MSDEERIMAELPGIGEQVFSSVEVEESRYPIFGDDRSAALFDDRLYRLERAVAQIDRLFVKPTPTRLDILSNWQLAVVFAVSVFDDLPPNLECPKIGEWGVFRRQLTQTLEVELVVATTSYRSDDGEQSYTDVRSHEAPFVRGSRSWEQEKTYVEASSLDELPSSDQIEEFVRFLGALAEAVVRWKDERAA